MTTMTLTYQDRHALDSLDRIITAWLTINDHSESLRAVADQLHQMKDTIDRIKEGV